MDVNYWRNIIPEGEKNAIRQETLAARLGVSGSTVKNRIAKARIDGIEICSSNNGYFFAENDEERELFVKMQEGQARKRFKTAAASKKKLQEYKGQLEIEEDGQMLFTGRANPEAEQEENRK